MKDCSGTARLCTGSLKRGTCALARCWAMPADFRILLAAGKYDSPESVNLGCGQEIAIAELGLIAPLVGYSGKLCWDAGRPNGQPRRCLDVSRAHREFGFQAKMPLREGLERTLAWYLAARKAMPER